MGTVGLVREGLAGLGGVGWWGRGVGGRVGLVVRGQGGFRGPGGRARGGEGKGGGAGGRGVTVAVRADAAGGV